MNTRILILAEHTHAALMPATYATICAAQSLKGAIDVLIAGHQAHAAAKAASQIEGVHTVLHCEDSIYANFDAEILAPLLARLASDYTHILAPACNAGKDALPRLAGMLDLEQVSDVLAIVTEDTFTHPIYAGRILETVQIHQSPQVLTVRASAFPPAPARTNQPPAPIEVCPAEKAAALSWRTHYQPNDHTRPALTQAPVVVTGGRGLKDAAQYQALLTPLAEQLNAALGGTRAAIEAQLAPYEAQIGQTGKIVAPQLYFAIGLSGAVQHVAGIKDSQVIVAINQAPQAPIFKVADYGLVADLFEAVPRLTQALADRKRT